MNKVAVFGNAGGGKSSLSRQLAEITGLPLYVLDIIQFQGGGYRPEEKDGGKIPSDKYLAIHGDILGRDQWIMPIHAHYWGVAKRWAMGLFQNPSGWPGNSPVWESTLDSWQVVWRCHRHLTPKYRQFVADAASSKLVYHFTSRTAMDVFLRSVADERRS
jgi:hypothetical protein